MVCTSEYQEQESQPFFHVALWTGNVVTRNSHHLARFRFRASCCLTKPMKMLKKPTPIVVMARKSCRTLRLDKPTKKPAIPANNIPAANDGKMTHFLSSMQMYRPDTHESICVSRSLIC